METKKIEHYFKNRLLDTFLGLCKPPLPTELPCLTPDSTVVFLRLSRIGDALISTPLIRFVKERFGCQTVVVADQCNHFIFQHNPSVDHVIVYRKGPLGCFWLLVFCKRTASRASGTMPAGRFQ